MELDIKPKFETKNLNIQVAGEGHTINLYKTPPFGQLTLEECEDLFRQRLEALCIIERTMISHDNVQLPIISNSIREIKSYVYKTNCILLRVNDAQLRKLDHFSHMLVRMYCIHHPHLWDWFKSCERKLLYFRLRDQANLSGGQLENILKEFNFDFERVRGSELSELSRENLIGWTTNSFDRELADIFKVRFVDALKFISKRSVSLKNGFAFLTRYDILSVVSDVYERHLENELNFARQHLNIELLQTQQLLESLNMVYLDYQDRIDEEKRKAKRDKNGGKQNPYKIDTENLGEVIKNHYPSCMRHIHEALVVDHHLKHGGRLHYGTFLRSGGVDMDEAIEFWRREFTKKIPNDKFERDYKYNIRHLYGREGKATALSCYSCDKIISDNPGPADKHGCPFKHFDDTHLRTMLTKHGLKDVDIESIFMQRNDKNYKLACSHYFKFTKGEFPADPIYNPSQFYYESMRLANRPPPEVPMEDEKITKEDEKAMKE